MKITRLDEATLQINVKKAKRGYNCTTLQTYKYMVFILELLFFYVREAV